MGSRKLRMVGMRRKAGARFLCGKLASPRADAPLLVQQRAEIVGDERALDQRSGTALGLAYHAGALGEPDSDEAQRRYLAGEKFGDLRRRWASIESIPMRQVTQPGNGKPLRTDAPDDVAQRALRMWRAATEALSGAGREAFRVVDGVAVDDVLPAALLQPGQVREALCCGLDALADFFRVR